MPKLRALVAAFLFFAMVGLLTVSANAGIITYSGSDPGANASDPRPNSDAAAASFDAANPGLPIITFESAPLGAFTNLAVAPGVTINGSDVFSAPQTIINSPLPDCGSEPVCGFNTTSGGSQWLSLYGGSVTFTFASPINAFGAYLSGVQVDGESITFNDGAPQSIGIVDPGSGVQFLGFSDTSAFSSVTINVLNDIVAVDDVRYGSPGSTGSAVPEPATFGLFGTALAGLGFLRRRLS
ncbi:MAG: PEP-CTERM sorting domain-containing protein [Bryobacteraceae bacterium]